MTILPTCPVGSTRLRVTTLGFGAASIGNLYRAVDDGHAAQAVDAAWDAGVRYFDTAPHYGLGLSERRLGAALARRPRDGYVLSTKVGRLLEPHPAPTGSDLANLFDVPDDLHRVLDYSADGVRRSIEESLTRLGTDRVDIALVHDPDDHVDQVLAEALPALIALRDEGVVGAVGVGMNQWQVPARFVRESDLDAVMLAGRWTLLDRSGATLLDACLDRGVSVIAAAPYNSGLLAHPEPRADAHVDYATPPDPLLRAARALAATATAHGTTLPAAALQFPLRHPAVASVVTGLATPEHARAGAERLTTPIPDAFWDAVDTTTVGVP